MARRQIIEKEKKDVFAKKIVKENPIFSVDDIEIFFNLFNLYADERRQCNVWDIVNTAKTLQFDVKHKLVYDAFYSIGEDQDGQWIRFEPFLKELTDRLGNPFTEEGRRAMFNLIDLECKDKLSFADLIKVSDYLGFSLTVEELQHILEGIVGKGKRQLTWDQFNEHIAKKIEKKSSFF